MNARGEIRETDTLFDDEIDTKDVAELKKLSPKARREYYRCIRANLSEEAAMSAANYVQRCQNCR